MDVQQNDDVQRQIMEQHVQHIVQIRIVAVLLINVHQHVMMEVGVQHH